MLKPNVPLNNALFQWLVKALAPGTAALGLPFLSQVSIAELRTYMGHTLLRDADQFSMAHALEVRVPFLDHRLVAAALAAPDVDKYPTTPKRLLVDALDGLLPEDLVNRPKMGFVMPWEAWMRPVQRPPPPAAAAFRARSRASPSAPPCAGSCLGSSRERGQAVGRR